MNKLLCYLYVVLDSICEKLSFEKRKLSLRKYTVVVNILLLMFLKRRVSDPYVSFNQTE